MNCKHCGKDILGKAVFLTHGTAVHEKCLDEYQRYVSGYKWACPKCNTTGRVKDSVGRTYKKLVPLGPGERPICAWDGCRGCKFCIDKVKNVEVPSMVECDLCSGNGFLKKEPVPIQKTVVVRWELTKGEK